MGAMGLVPGALHGEDRLLDEIRPEVLVKGCREPDLLLHRTLEIP
jgi:hypothetical protein